MDKLIVSSLLLLAACDEMVEQDPDAGTVQADAWVFVAPDPGSVWDNIPVNGQEIAPACQDAPYPVLYNFGVNQVTITFTGGRSHTTGSGVGALGETYYVDSVTDSKWLLREQEWKILAPNVMYGFTDVRRVDQSCRIESYLVLRHF